MRNLRLFALIFAAVYMAGINVSSAGTLIDVAFTGATVTSKTGFAATGVTANDFWNTYVINSGASLNLEFTDGTASGAALSLSPGSGYAGYPNAGITDPMYDQYMYSVSPFSITVTNLIAGLYDFFLYGHGGADNQNSVFQLSVGQQIVGSEETTNGSGYLSPIWQEGVQYVEFTNVSVAAGRTITFTVSAGASPYAAISGLQMEYVNTSTLSTVYILTQPADQQAAVGSTATLSVVAGGAGPLVYQWLFDGASISGATNSTYRLTNVQPANLGSYSVIVSNVYGSLTSWPALLNVYPQVSSLINVAFTSFPVTSKMGVAAVGVTTNDFWNTYDMNLGPLTNLKFEDGTVSGAGLTLAGATGAYSDAATDPMYSTYVYTSGNVPVSMTVTVTNLAAGKYDIYLYGHGGANDQNSLFHLSVDSLSYGSEATTNGSGYLSWLWQEGVQYVEFTNVVVLSGQTIAVSVQQGARGFAVLSGLQIAPVGATSSGPYVVTEPTNQQVMAGSTATFSVVASGAAPLAFQWLFEGASISEATNSSFSVTNVQPANAGIYSVIVSNPYASVTSAVAILNVYPPVESLINVAFTGVPVTSKTGIAAVGATANDFWNTYDISVGPLSNLKFEDGTVSGAGLSLAGPVGAYGNAAADPMYATYVYPDSYTTIDMTMTITNLAAGAYDIYLYGHGAANNQNSLFQLAVDAQSYGSEMTTNGSGYLSQEWQEGVQYVEFTNVSVLAGQTITISVEPGASMYAVLAGLQVALIGPVVTNAFIISPPVSQSVIQGAAANFSVVAVGAPPLAYQWLWNNSIISGATNNSYTVGNAQPADVGNYSVIVTNAYGSTTSAAAALILITPVAQVIDVAFTTVPATSKTGFAATGVTSNDFWNTCDMNTNLLTNLKFEDGTPSGAGLTLANALGAYNNGATDPMYDTYLYTVFSADISVTLTNLSAGIYDFYLYGHGVTDDQNSVFQLSVDSLNYGSEATTNGSGYLSQAWEEGVQYVEFTNVGVNAGQMITIRAEKGASDYSLISGLQVVPVAAAPGSPFIETLPASQLVIQGSAASLNVVAGGATPLAYQWFLNGAAIFAATNSSFILPNAQPANAGNYTVIVTNAVGRIVSPEAALNVIVPVTNVIDVAFTSDAVTAKTGFAATGVTTNDFWNTCNPNSGSLPSLDFRNSSASGVGLTLNNAFSGAPVSAIEAATNGASDPMYGDYLFTLSFPMSVVLTNLNTGLYNIYLYGHGVADDQNSVFLLSAGSWSYGSEGTTNGSGWLSPVWQEGVQYVAFTNVVVLPGQSVTITVEPGGNALLNALSGLQIASAIIPTNTPPLIMAASMESVRVYKGVPIINTAYRTNEVKVYQSLSLTNYAFSANGPISFTLGSNAPSGASITTNGIFTWTPTCEQGNTTNLITVWASDSSTPPLSNSTTFSVIVGECVEISIGSSVVQAGQDTSVPVSLFTTVGLTNLNFTLSPIPGFLTNWSLSSSNPAIASATVAIVNMSQPQFSFGVQSGQTLQGASVIGSINLETWPGRSAFVPLVLTSFGATTSGNAPATLYSAQGGRVVVVGNQPLLEAAEGLISNRTLVLFGNPGQSIILLATTNLAKTNSWTAFGTVTLTNMFQSVSLGSMTNPAQFFQAVQP